MSKLESVIQNSLYEFIRVDYKNLFMATIRSVKMIVLKCLEQFREFNKEDLEHLRQLLDRWESDYAYSLWQNYHSSMLKFIDNELLLEENSEEKREPAPEIIFPVSETQGAEMIKLNE